MTYWIRWMIRKDMPAVYEIERASFDDPWTEDEFLKSLRLRNCIGMVAEHGEQVVGFMIYELFKDRIHLLNFAVHPDRRRAGCGAAMMERLKGKLFERRNAIVLEIRETNLAGQQFFRHMKVHATGIVSEFFSNGEDAFKMVFPPPDPPEIKNRIVRKIGEVSVQ